MMNPITLHLAKDGLFRFYGVHHRFQSDSGIFLTAEQYFCISFQSFRKNVHPKNPGIALKRPKPSHPFRNVANFRCPARSAPTICEHFVQLQFSPGQCFVRIPLDELSDILRNRNPFATILQMILFARCRTRAKSPRQSLPDGICFCFR